MSKENNVERNEFIKKVSFTREMNMTAKKKKNSVGHEFKNEAVTWQFVEELLLTSAEEIVWNWEQGKSEVNVNVLSLYDHV